jgi:hypothetical protein
MSQELDFKKLQVRTYQSYQQDGLIDIIIGLMIIGFGLYMAIDNSAFIFLTWIPILFYIPLKNRITVPRIGYVKFSSSRMRLIIGILLALIAFVFLVGIFLYLSSGSISPELTVWIKKYYMLVLAAIAAFAFTSAAILTGISRLYGYALLILVVFAAGIWLDVQPAIYVLICGLLIEAAGIWLLVRFLRKYPLAEQEGVHE